MLSLSKLIPSYYRYYKTQYHRHSLGRPERASWKSLRFWSSTPMKAPNPKISLRWLSFLSESAVVPPSTSSQSVTSSWCRNRAILHCEASPTPSLISRTLYIQVNEQNLLIFRSGFATLMLSSNVFTPCRASYFSAKKYHRKTYYGFDAWCFYHSRMDS